MSDFREHSVRVLLNPHAGSAYKVYQLREALATLASRGWKVTLRETHTAEEATALAQEAAEAGIGLVAAAGGDGAIHAVLRGLMRVWQARASSDNGAVADRLKTGLAVIPMGTGNDFSRTLGLPLDLAGAVAAIADRPARLLDVIRIEAQGRRHFMINVAAGGNSGAVAEMMTEELKQRWGAWCYVRGALDVLTELQPYRIELDLDGERIGPIEALNVVVANGRTVAGGVRVAPRANPEDGLLDAVVVLNVSLLETAAVAAEYVLGDYLEHESVVFGRARRVELHSEPAMTFSADGELITGNHFVFQTIPRMLRVVVGPDYTPEPFGAGAAS